jgi:hypothetical protein
MAVVEATEGNTTRTLKEAVLDPLDKLWTPGNHAHAKVGLQVGTQVDMGRIHIRAWCEYECDQNESIINEAGLKCFSKAVEFMNDGLSLLKEGVG